MKPITLHVSLPRDEALLTAKLERVEVAYLGQQHGDTLLRASTKDYAAIVVWWQKGTSLRKTSGVN